MAMKVSFWSILRQKSNLMSGSCEGSPKLCRWHSGCATFFPTFSTFRVPATYFHRVGKIRAAVEMHNTLSFQWKFRYFFGPGLSFGPFQKKVHDEFFFNSAPKFNFRTSSTQSSKTFSKPEKNFFFNWQNLRRNFFSSNLRRSFGFWSFRKFWFDFSKVCQIGGEGKFWLVIGLYHWKYHTSNSSSMQSFWHYCSHTNNTSEYYIELLICTLL